MREAAGPSNQPFLALTPWRDRLVAFSMRATSVWTASTPPIVIVVYAGAHRHSVASSARRRLARRAPLARLTRRTRHSLPPVLGRRSSSRRSTWGDARSTVPRCARRLAAGSGRCRPGRIDGRQPGLVRQLDPHQFGGAVGTVPARAHVVGPPKNDGTTTPTVAGPTVAGDAWRGPVWQADRHRSSTAVPLEGSHDSFRLCGTSTPPP